METVGQDYAGINKREAFTVRRLNCIFDERLDVTIPFEDDGLKFFPAHRACFSPLTPER